jgi:hypothetical protein
MWNNLEAGLSNQGRTALHIVMWASAIAGLACAVWLVAAFLYLLQGGGTYSATLEDGSIACRIPVFPEGQWFWPAFSLFGAPAALLAACVRTVNHCSRLLGVAGRAGR